MGNNDKRDLPANTEYLSESNCLEHDELVSSETFRAKEWIGNEWREGVVETTVTKRYGLGQLENEPTLRESIEYTISNNEAHAQHHAQHHGYTSTLQKVPIHDHEGNRTRSGNAGLTKEPSTLLRCAYDLERSCNLLSQSLERIDVLNLPADIHREVILAIHRGMDVRKYEARLGTRENAKVLLAGAGLFNNSSKHTDETQAAAVMRFTSLTREQGFKIGEAEKLIQKEFNIGRTKFRQWLKKYG